VLTQEKKLEKEVFDVFYGPVIDNKDRLIVPYGESLSDTAIRSMNWFVKRVTQVE
jgi:hypothetical protein